MKRFLFAMLLLVWVSPFSVFAQCGQQIDDQANVFGAKAPQVQAAVDKLVSDTGADVHVFTVSSMGAASSFEKYVHHVINTCPAWQGVDGGVKSNLIVVAVALKERKTAIIFGSEWKSALDSQHQRIQSSNINSRFKSGDFAGGFIAGLSEIDRVAVAFLHPTTSTQSAPLPIASPDTRPVSTTNFDFSGLGKFLLLCMLILSAIFVLFVLYRLFTELKKNRDARNLAQQKAIRAREKITERYLSSEMAVGEVGAELFSLQHVVSVADAARANEFFSQAELACKEGMASHLRLLQTSGDPGKPGLTVAQYDDMCREYKEVEEVFVRMDGLLESAMTEVKKIQRVVESAEATVKASEAAIVETEKIVSSAKADGLDVPSAEKAIKKARESFREALEFLDQKQYGELITKLKVATDAVNRADNIVASILQKKADLHKSLDRLGEIIGSAPEVFKQAGQTLVTVKEKFNILDYNLAFEYFDKARKLATSAEEKWGNCKFLVSVQHWDSALATVEEVEKLLTEMHTTCEAIGQLPATLAKLEAELEGKAVQAEALVKKLSDFTREHKNELPTELTREVEQFEVRLRLLTENVRGSLTGVAESTDMADMLIKEGEEFLSRAAAAVRKVEQGRARAHERNRSARFKGKSDKKGKSKDNNSRRSSREHDNGSMIIIPVDSSIDSRDDLDRTSSRSSSYGSGSSSRRSSDSSSGGGDSSWGGGSSGFGGGDSGFGGGGSSGGGDSSW